VKIAPIEASSTPALDASSGKTGPMAAVTQPSNKNIKQQAAKMAPFALVIELPFDEWRGSSREV
jgi:hypothetical protein